VAGGTAIGVAIGQPSQLASILERGTGTMLAIGCPTGAAVAVPAIVDGAEVVTVVPGDHPAVTVTPRVGIDPSRPLTEFRLDQFPAGDGLATVPAAHTSWVTRVGLVAALDAAGAARTALSRTIAYAKERHQFGRPIGSFQAYKHRCADMFIELQLAQSIAFRAAGQIDSPLPLSAALLAPEAAVAVCGDAIQLHGGIGFTWEAGLHVHLKRARSDQIIAACSGATADALLARRRSPSSPPIGPD
jgi:alkylation response protein AidB-like acyl-CoA dehydrogenase